MSESRAKIVHMASIRKRETATKTSWQVRWRTEGKQHSESFSTQGDAKKFAGMVDAAGQKYPPKWVPGKGFEDDIPLDYMTVGEWCRRMVASRIIEEQTRTDYFGMLKNHLGDLDQLRLEDVTTERAGLWLQSIKGKPKTVKNIHGLVSSCFQDAVSDGQIKKNPLRKMQLPRTDGPDAEEMTILTRSQVEQISSRMREHYRPLVWFLYLSGCRLGEAMALQVRHVDVFNRKISVMQAYKRTPGGDRIGATKTKRGNRTIGIPQELVDYLIPLTVGRQPGDFVFTTERGARLRGNHWRSDYWVPAVGRANICDFHWNKHERDEPCGCEATLGLRPTPKDLRHSHTSFLIDAGISPKKIQHRLGHVSITTTYDTYGHLFPKSEDEILAALESMQSSNAQSVEDTPAPVE
ncbi:MAG: site-specific integrase [Candidatus Nanopelagicales bacterium]